MGIDAKYECIFSSGLFIVKSSCWESAGSGCRDSLTLGKLNSFCSFETRFSKWERKAGIRYLQIRRMQLEIWEASTNTWMFVQVNLVSLSVTNWNDFSFQTEWGHKEKQTIALNVTTMCFWKTWFWSSRISGPCWWVPLCSHI